MPATDINSVVIIGRLTRDAELRYLPSGTPVASFSIAVNRNRRDGDQWVEEANFFDIALFGKGAESRNQYLKKGTQVAVQGSLRQERWERDGQKHSKVSIVANTVELFGGRTQGQGGGDSSSYQPRNSNTAKPSAPAYNTGDGADDASGFPEDIPF